jgi:type IV pilus assembly protein PilX
MTYLSTKEQGSVLVITLVILLIITLISVTNLTSASNQTRIINNAQQANQTFNAAEAAMSQALFSMVQTAKANSDMKAMQAAVTGKTPTKISVTDLKKNHMAVTLTYTANSVNGLRSGISLDASNSDNMIRNINFTIESNATIANSGITSTIVRGFVYE